MQSRKCKISIINISLELINVFDKIARPAHINNSAFYRFLSPRLIPYKKIIYLDSDLIVVKDIFPLFKLSIRDYFFCAVESITHISQEKRLGIKKYINSGVLLMNLEFMRKSNFEKIMFDWIENNLEKIQICDQDIINGAFSNEIKFISCRYNFYHKLSESVNTYKLPTDPKDYEESAKSPCIIHFVGKIKPWHKNSKHVCKSEFWRYA